MVPNANLAHLLVSTALPIVYVPPAIQQKATFHLLLAFVLKRVLMMELFAKHVLLLVLTVLPNPFALVVKQVNHGFPLQHANVLMKPLIMVPVVHNVFHLA